MASPIDDVYSTQSGGTIRAGLFDQTSSVQYNFTNGVPLEINLNSDFPGYVGLKASALPPGVTLQGLTKKLVYDGVTAITEANSGTVNITATGSMPSFTVANANATSVPAVVGCVFPKGALSSDPVGTTNGQTFKVLRHWNDGSPKHGVAIGVFPANTEIRLSDVAPTGTILTEAQLAAAVTADGRDNIVDLGATGSVNLTSLLGNPQRVTYETRKMVEALYRYEFPSTDIQAWFQVRYFSHGEIFIRAWLERGYMIRGVVTSTAVTVSGTVTLFGTAISTGSIALHKNAAISFNASAAQFQRWSGATQYAFTVNHDKAQIAATKLIPEYGKITGATESTLSGYLQAAYVGNIGQHRAAWFSSGFHQGHALLSGWHTAWAKSNDPRAYKAVIANDDAVGQFALRWRTSAGDIMGPSDNLTGNFRGTSGSLSGLPTEGMYNGSYTCDEAHFPGGVGYVSYLLTGDEFYLDLMKGCVSFYYQRMTAGSTGDGVGRLHYRNDLQVRSIGWFFKVLTMATAIVPDNDRNLADYRAWLANNTQFFYDNSVGHVSGGPDVGLGIPYAADDEVPEGTWAGFQKSPFEIAYWLMSMGNGKNIEPLEATEQATFDALTTWFYRFIVGILGDSSGFCFTKAAAYRITIGPASVSGYTELWSRFQYQTWEECWDALAYAYTVCGNTLATAAGDFHDGQEQPFDGSSYWYVLWAALQFALEHNATTSIGTAQQSLARLQGATNWNSFNTVSAGTSWNTIPSPYGLTPHVAVQTQSKSLDITVTAAQQPPGDSVVNDIWTPPLDGNGNVVLASVQDIPLSTATNLHFVEVANTPIRPLETKILEKFNATYGTHETSYGAIVFGTQRTALGLFNGGFSGGTLAGNRWYSVASGGHSATSDNSIRYLDLNKLGTSSMWGCERAPSWSYAPGDSVYTDSGTGLPVPLTWPSGYRNLTATETFSQFLLPGLEPVSDILPDQQPTSRHNYGGVCYDSTANALYDTSRRLWRYNLTTKVTDNDVLWCQGATKTTLGITAASGEFETSVNEHAFYNEHSDKIVMTAQYKKTIGWSQPVFYTAGLWLVDKTTGEVTQHTFNIAPNYGEWQFVRSGDYLYWSGKRVDGTDGLSYYDMTTDAWVAGTKTYGDIPTAWPELFALAAAPDIGKLVRWAGTTDWRLIDTTTSLDPVSGTNRFKCTRITPTGRVPAYAGLVGNKLFYYPAWKCIIAIQTTNLDSNAIFIARIG